MKKSFWISCIGLLLEKSNFGKYAVWPIAHHKNVHFSVFREIANVTFILEMSQSSNLGTFYPKWGKSHFSKTFESIIWIHDYKAHSSLDNPWNHTKKQKKLLPIPNKIVDRLADWHNDRLTVGKGVFRPISKIKFLQALR